MTYLANLVRKQAWMVWSRQTGIGSERVNGDKPPEKSNRQFVSHDSNFLLTSDFLSSLHFSKAQRNVAQIRVWGGWETGKQREGRKRDKRNQQLSVYTSQMFVSSSLSSSPLFWLQAGQSVTQTHKGPRDTTQQLQGEITARVCAKTVWKSVSEVSTSRGASPVKKFLW